MKTKHYFLTLLLTASFSALFGQRNRVDYDRDTKWNFGLNAGGTWQEKELDFVNYPGFSGGLTLGRSIYEKEGRLLSFDLRGRLLAGQTSGWSTVPSYDSTLFSNHPDGVGYKNYRFEYGEGSLELVVNAHRLRERTGILLYGFGGVGLVSHSIKHNYKDGADWYDYSLVDSTANKDLVAFNLKSFFNDKKWETDNAFFSGNQTLVMPSLGLGLGYQVTPQFSLGVEHKVTFGLNDNLDGYIDGKNDRYHYTNFNLRWNLFRGNGTGNGSYIPEERPLPNQGGNPNPSSNGNVDDYSTNPSTDVPQGNKPLVNITRPASNGGSVYTMNYNVKAKVYYVDGRNDIVFKHNGVIVNSFNYSPSSKVLEVNVILTPGANTFVVTGTNAYGSDTDTKTINYNKICNKPTITYTQPLNNGKVISVASTTIKAKILNVSNRNMLVFKHNGVMNNNFTFNTSTKAFVATVNCVEGSNVFEIEARNECGEKSNSRTIVFNEPIKNTPPPIVTITNPNTSPYTTTASSYNLGATVLYVDGASQIQFKLNGVATNAFSYNVNTKVLNASINLQNGNNVVEIKATNPYGMDTKTTVIVRKQLEQTPPPVVTISYPATSPYSVSVNNSVVNGMVYNVNSSSQIQVTVNGMLLNNFVYNTSTKKISFTANLNLGSNVVSITATNIAGVDTKSTTIVYKKPVAMLPPVVSFINPMVSPYTVSMSNFTVKAKVLNVTSANQITVTHNGTVIPASFNNSTKEVIINQPLISGNNVFVVTGTNNAGVDTKSTTIVYKKPVAMLPPVVSFINPTVSPYTVSMSNFTVKAKVLNVTSANQITVTHNGTVIPASFNNSTKEVIINQPLISGNNVFVVTGTNNAGVDTKSTTIVYKKPVAMLPPVVSFINPTVSPYTVNMSSFTVNAKVLNVTSANQITVTHNGTAIPVFNFNTNTKEVVINKTLVAGNNVFVVTGTNSAGVDTKSTTIIYRKLVTLLPPVVTFITPQGNPYNTTNANEVVTARVDNVNSQSQISLTYNGVQTSNFSYNSSTKMVTYNAALNMGSNTLSVAASNSSGTDSKSKTLIRKKPCVAPVLAYQIPLQSPHNHVGRDGNMAFTFSSANITSVSQISVTNNGYNVHVNLEQTNGNIWGTVPLKVGANKLIVKVENECGKAEKVLDVMYKGNTSKLVPPVITIQTPTSFPHTTAAASVTVVGKIDHVSSQNNVQVTMDGTNIPFTYNTATKVLTIVTNLTVGSHQVRVRAQNNYGNDMEVFDLVRTGPQIKAPIVQYTNLGNGNSYRSPFVSPQRSYTVQGRVVNHQNVTLNVYMNGNRLSNYSYNASTGVFSIPVAFPLQGQGTQRRVEVEVRASNSAGQHAKKGHLVYMIQSISTNPSTGNVGSSSTQTYKNYISKADSYYRKGELNQAKVYYQKAAQANPKASLPKQRLAEISKKLKAQKEVAKPVVKPITKPATKPITKPTVKPNASKVETKPAETKPVVKPSVEQKGVNKWTTKPIEKP